jgi:hypothetical protein
MNTAQYKGVAKLFMRRKQLLVRKPTFQTRYFFTLIATNGEAIAQSEAYNQKESALETLNTYFPNFMLDDRTAEKPYKLFV